MASPGMVMYEEEFHQIMAVIDKLVKDSNSKVVFLVDKNGQLIGSAGETENLDTTSLASLTAGNIAATGGLAKLLGEKESLHISNVPSVPWIENRSPAELVRLIAHSIMNPSG